jgi:hypothetical protein
MPAPYHADRRSPVVRASTTCSGEAANANLALDDSFRLLDLAHR